MALAAFARYRHAYDDWEGFSKNVGNMASLSGSGKIVAAEEQGELAEAVAYIGPGQAKAAFFRPHWSVMRMLVVGPTWRGLGIGSLLAQACVDRATRDNADVIALHTSRLMSVALSMHERMGFGFHAEAPEIHRVPYGVYTKRLRV